ncbi:ABC transporter permease [Herbiconiux sp. KACC 21604]|uniref:ABC transporter permease n=1 Tax=unclassified Herbiconiux TaxID=2618217 RepID=UPI00149109BD|nr:ABC transporter permease [Herbiconiux sp. SALV-R1]QJU54466.1 ABC transporter permease [Herbiconiux sp. SALV-R1]WPO85544.1 ABC transporter permease [Herbiconiux sp. KACC 21604]
MFVALRDLRFAKGRFALIGSVVALITVLVGFLSGLTGGLAVQNVSAVLALPGDRIVFADPSGDGGSPAFADSAISPDQLAQWSAADGVRSATPVGISQLRAAGPTATAAVAVFGAPSGDDLAVPNSSGQVLLSAPAADALGASAGDVVDIAGVRLTVAPGGVDPGAEWYSHTPVVTVTLDDWRTISAATGSPDATATVVAVSGDPDWTAVSSATSTVAESHLGALGALSAFRSEIGSLLLMVALLFGISGLVVGAFFTVWGMQRSADVAVLKALGASTASLVRDALGQALVVLLAGIGLGTLSVVGFGLLAGQALPFLLSPVTTALPAALMTVLGLAGAAFALRTVTSSDPLTALGSAR